VDELTDADAIADPDKDGQRQRHGSTHPTPCKFDLDTHHDGLEHSKFDLDTYDDGFKHFKWNLDSSCDGFEHRSGDNFTTNLQVFFKRFSGGGEQEHIAAV